MRGIDALLAAQVKAHNEDANNQVQIQVIHGFQKVSAPAVPHP
jgi:hypothetical protein